TDPSDVTFLADTSLYATPARAIANYRRLFEVHLAAGAWQIRIAGDVPHQGNGGRFEGWDRYEAAGNTVWEGFPVWGLSLYAPPTRPAAVRAIVERTPPRIVSPSGARQASHRYQDPLAFEGLPYAPDPLEDSTPLVELVDRPATEARQALVHISRGRVADTILDDLLIGVSEAIGNAVIHGRAPASVRMWATTDRIVICVHDQGHGPADPLAGLIPSVSTTASLGFGLWLIHQLDIDVALKHADDGFTIRLRSGAAMG